MGAYKSFVINRIPKGERVIISGGNPKIGHIYNTSFPRIVTCNPDAPCVKKGCYMASREGFYKTAREAYYQNLRLYQTDPQGYWGQMREFLFTVEPKAFRYFVDGDMPDMWYLFYMSNTARHFPNTVFTAYTKRYDWISRFKDTHILPANLILLASAWPNFDIPASVTERYRVVWMDDGTEKRMPDDAVKCTGHCPDCMVCYDPNNRLDVVISKHQ